MNLPIESLRSVRPTNPILVRYRGVPAETGYQCGDNGTVWSAWPKGRRFPNSKPTAKWKLLKPMVKKETGHLYVQIQGKQRYIHRLILESFVGPCPPGLMCRHLDGNPTNNRLDNLSWGTVSENAQDAIRHGARAYPNAKLSIPKVREIRRLFAEGRSKMSLARQFEVSDRTIRKIVNELAWIDKH